MKVLIINFNRLTLTRNTCEWCVEHGLVPIILDNNSDYPPLLDFYNNSPFKVLRLKVNYGHTVIWNYPVLKELGITDRFILTDPDLDFTGVPDDFLKVMNDGLDKYPQFSKCGLSLEINDLPTDEEGLLIRHIESKYWQFPLDDLYFEADTDTTFALYRQPMGPCGHSAIRTNRPYTVKHLPWHYRDLSELPEDEQNYYKTANAEFSSGLKRLKL